MTRISETKPHRHRKVAARGPRTGAAAAEILAWYDRGRRQLPWRYDPGAVADPYAVWLSEIMLQQTTVAAVVPYFHRFVAKWPTVGDLAAAPLDDVLAAWAGLGYYARARNLHRCAGVVTAAHGGVFPDTEAGLSELPGIGPYTAAAIAAIAFGRRAVVVDGNVERVMARLHDIHDPLPAAKPELRAAADALTPAQRAGDYAQAVMDLGATVCTPRAPRCDACPWRRRCRARRAGSAAVLPRRVAKKASPLRRGTALWISRPDGAVLLRRRPPRGLLGGMLEFPSTPWRAEPQPFALAEVLPATHAKVLERGRVAPVPGEIEHTFTHFKLILTVRRVELSDRAAAAIVGDDLLWTMPRDFGRSALPNVMRKLARHVAQSRP